MKKIYILRIRIVYKHFNKNCDFSQFQKNIYRKPLFKSTQFFRTTSFGTVNSPAKERRKSLFCLEEYKVVGSTSAGIYPDFPSFTKERERERERDKKRKQERDLGKRERERDERESE